MGVQRGNDQVDVVVLQLRQMVAELRAVMVVDQRQRAGRVLRLARPGLLWSACRGATAGWPRCGWQTAAALQ